MEPSSDSLCDRFPLLSRRCYPVSSNGGFFTTSVADYFFAGVGIKLARTVPVSPLMAE